MQDVHDDLPSKRNLLHGMSNTVFLSCSSDLGVPLLSILFSVHFKAQARDLPLLPYSGQNFLRVASQNKKIRSPGFQAAPQICTSSQLSNTWTVGPAPLPLKTVNSTVRALSAILLRRQR